MKTKANERCIVVLASLTLSLVLTTNLQAADPEILHEDEFSTLDSAFTSSEHTKIAVEANELVVTPQPGWGYNALYQSSLFDDIDFSVQAKLSDPDAEKGAYLGICFWAANYNDYYMLAFSDSGTVAVLNWNGKRTLYPVPWRQTDALKTGNGDWNLLRVVTVGNYATVYVNGKKLASFRGRPPQGGSLLGAYCISGSDQMSGRFRALKVIAPSGADKNVPKGEYDPNTFVNDTFAALDPGWGVESGSISVKDNVLTLRPNPGYGLARLYQSAAAEEIDATAKLRVRDGDAESYSSGGIIFWANAYDDYFVFTLSDGGLIGCSRLKGQKWLNPMANKAPPAESKLQADGFNELRVVTAGKKATLYLNGVSVGSISNPQAKGESQFGVYGDSGKSQSTIEFQVLKVVKPAN